MNTVKRAWLYITRKKGRSILLFAVLLVIAALLTASLSIRSSADAAAQEVRQSLGGSFEMKLHLDVDNSALWEYVELEDGTSGYTYIGPSLTDAEADRISALDGIRARADESETGLLDTGLALKPGLWSNMDPDDPYYGEESITWKRGVHMFVVSDSMLQPFFRNGALSIAEGRHLEPDDEYKVVISEDTAERNELGVGDTFDVSINESFVDANGSMDKIVGEAVLLEIVGIFKINFEYEPSPYSAEAEIAENFMFTDFATEDLVRKYLADYYGRVFTGERSYGQVTFFVEDPKDLDGIIAEAKAIEDIDWKYYDIEKDDTAYQAQIGPLETIGTLTLVLSAVLIAGCAVVLYLIFAMWVKGRRREIGILRATGFKRRGILGQFLTESLLIAAVSLAAAFFLAGPVTDAIGKVTVSLAEGGRSREAYEVTYSDLEGSSIEQVAADVQLAYGVDWTGFGIVCAIEAGIIILSISISTESILRMSPRRILSD